MCGQKMDVSPGRRWDLMNLDLMNQQQKWQMQEEQFGDVTGPNTAENLNLSIPTSEKYAMSNYPSSQNVVRKKNKKNKLLGYHPCV